MKKSQIPAGGSEFSPLQAKGELKTFTQTSAEKSWLHSRTCAGARVSFFETPFLKFESNLSLE
ncbi:MAG: hypothetical protein D6805_04850 [Planctomycetota bacterium]|nr:MAG: hypothetical protein D6805_04850 [Planctomycetota bacterium]